MPRFLTIVLLQVIGKLAWKGLQVVTTGIQKENTGYCCIWKINSANEVRLVYTYTTRFLFSVTQRLAFTLHALLIFLNGSHLEDNVSQSLEAVHNSTAQNAAVVWPLISHVHRILNTCGLGGGGGEVETPKPLHF